MTTPVAETLTVLIVDDSAVVRRRLCARFGTRRKPRPVLVREHQAEQRERGDGRQGDDRRLRKIRLIEGNRLHPSSSGIPPRRLETL